MIRIDLQNVTKSFQGQPVIRDVSLSAEPGELLCLLGPSGVGKSTLLKMVAGLFGPDEGDILFDGRSVLSLPVESRGAVLVFQDYSLFPHMTVEENVGFGLRMAGRTRAERQRSVAEMLELVEMNGSGAKYPRELSGGQQQRVALARALAIHPRVLLLDEPFSNLDARLRRSMSDFTRRLQRRLGITTLLVTHDCEEALMMSDRIAMVLGGEVYQVGTPEGVYRSPQSPEVADFFGPRNYLKGRVSGGVLSFPLGRVEGVGEPDGAYRVMIRPEALRQAVSGGLSVTVEQVAFAGERVHYVFITDEGSLLSATFNNGQRFKEGDRLSLEAYPDDLILFPVQTGQAGEVNP